MELKNKYIEAIGRRKTATARVRLFKSNKLSFKINDKDINYFPTKEMQVLIQVPFREVKNDAYEVSAKLTGGGIHSQAEALRHGISRALTKENEVLRKPLKQAGFLKRDSRAKERRKFGLKKARKAPQWSKR
jgi:small subunit ribosomal protein S9